MNTDTATTSRAVQSDNYKAMSAAKLSAGQQRVMNAVLLAHARRQRDLSLPEICLVMEEQLGRRVASNDISGRITELVTAGILRRTESRACSVTGKDCNPVFAVAKQAELGLAVKARANAYGAAKARADITRSATPASDSRVSGMPPEVRARLAAIRQAAGRVV
jgi:hypothetical protein